MTARILSAPIAEPLKKYGGAIGRLLETPAFSHGRAADELFCAAMREAARAHYKGCPAFRGVWRAADFKPVDIKTMRDVERMPFIFVAAFKERDFLVSVPKSRVELELTSSGTSGQRSRIVLDEASLLRVRRMAWQVFDGLGLADRSAPCDYLCFTYDPHVAKNLGTAFTDELITGLTRAGKVYYALEWDKEKNGFFFNIPASIAALERFEKSGRPVRLVGFPAHAMLLCEEFKKAKGRYARLHKDSWVITGGGWKDQQDRAVDKTVMRRKLASCLGLHESRVRDLFGMVEHGVPYIDCPLGKFHVPIYGRIIVRHPATLEALPYGQTGLLQFITPYLTSYPSISLLSSDMGWLEEKCSCGLKGPVMHIAGRAGVKKLKGCAISASTLL